MLLSTSLIVLPALFSTINAGVMGQHPRQTGVRLTSIPAADPNPAARAAAVAVKKNGYQYVASLLGNGSYFLGGTLGTARVQSDIAGATIDLTAQNNAIGIDVAAVTHAVTVAGRLTTLQSYTDVLYKGQWLASIPQGEAPGALTNYTQDLFFSMERLSLNPYPLRRLGFLDPLPFTVEALTLLKVTNGLYGDLNVIKAVGRLFVVDHSNQVKYAHATDKYGAACTAYFYINPLSGDFLPLAIKTIVGSNLVYTPADLSADWLLAKMMFNVNDLFHAEASHLASHHDVGEIIHEAALRTLSDNHPVFVLVDHLMNLAYSVRPIGEARLFNPGGNFDQTFYINNIGIRQYATDMYSTIGAIKSKYLETDLTARGLINAILLPAFKNFPFNEDVSATKAIIKTFITDFINSYYASDAALKADIELNAWFLEAQTAAQAVQFPCSPGSCTRTDLIDFLTHIATLTGVTHHILNTGDLTLSLGVLPFHPAALYAPVPTAKGVTSVLPFLPPVSNAINQVVLMAAFNRPQYEAAHKTLAWAYNDTGFLARFNAKVASSAAAYQAAMLAFSAKIRARAFDKSGLCQGMPFIWRAVDPGTIPWFFAI